METLLRDFVSEENRSFGLRMGRRLASALSGFLAGAVVSSIVWMAAFTFTRGLGL